MNRLENPRGGDARERSRPGLFVSGMAVAVAGFMLLFWAPGQGLMFAGAIISFGGTVFLSVEAWRQAARRWTPARADGHKV